MQKPQGTLKLLGKIGSFYEALIPVLAKFPKAQRYTMAQNIEKETLDCIRLVYFAAFQKSDRIESLRSLRARFHLLSKLIGISSNLHLLPDTQYKILTQQLDEMGKLVSQWIKTEYKKEEELQRQQGLQNNSQQATERKSVG